jgi:hypothetical protein
MSRWGVYVLFLAEEVQSVKIPLSGEKVMAEMVVWREGKASEPQNRGKLGIGRDMGLSTVRLRWWRDMGVAKVVDLINTLKEWRKCRVGAESLFLVRGIEAPWTPRICLGLGCTSYKGKSNQ